MDITRFDLSQARKSAKELLRSPDPERFRRHHPDFAASAPREIKLADCQLVVAREAGFPSWAKLKHAIEQRDSDLQQRAADLVESALNADLPRTLSLLSESPLLPGYDFATALVTGDAETLSSLLEEEPSLARGEYSSRRLPPLLLCTRTVLARPGLTDTPAPRDFPACVRLLATAGSDVNQKVPFDPPWQSASGTPLYYAAGYHGNRELTRALLELGATPNDGETLYHAIEKGDPELLRLLHPYNKSLAEWSYAFLHLMDYENTAVTACMLELGVDLNHRHPQSGETPLHWAVKHGRSAAVLDLLLRAGADPSAPDGAGVGAYERAARSGDIISAGAIERSGHRKPLDPVSQVMLAAAMDDAVAVRAVIAEHPDVLSQINWHDRCALHRAAGAGRTTAIRGLIRLVGIDVDTADTSGATALHHACLNGHPDTVAALIEAKASLDIPDRTHQSIPLGWACWASENAPFARKQDELVKVVDMLLTAGGPKPADLWGSPRVQEVLKRHGMT